MITDYDYITTTAPQVWWWLFWVPVIILSVSLLITLLYTIFARKRTAEGYGSRLGYPMVANFLLCIVLFGVLFSVNASVANDNAQIALEKMFDNVSYDGDSQFTATTKDGIDIRGALLDAEEREGDYERFAVIYVATKE